MKSIFYSLVGAGKKNLLFWLVLMMVTGAQAKNANADDRGFGKRGIKNKTLPVPKMTGEKRALTSLAKLKASALRQAIAMPLACPCTLFGASDAPAPAETNRQDVVQAMELGVKVQADVNGYIFGIRFYKSSNDLTATHTATLWDAAGAVLATAVFTGETASGWQQVLFATPVPVVAGTTYVATYYSPDGYYSATNNYFTAGLAAPPLNAVVDGGSSGVNGVYDYDALATGPGTFFPLSSFQASNYWVDVVFGPNLVLPVSLANFKATALSTDVQLTWQTLSEQNNLGFEVQRSTNGTDWADIAFVKGAGESNTVLEYSYTDKNLAPDHYSYRLKQINLDNNFVISLVAGAAIKPGAYISLSANYPNPFVDHTTIQYELPASTKVRLTVMDIHGRTIRVLADQVAAAGKHLVDFDAKSLSSGLYYYKLETNGQSAAIVRKMVLKR